MFRLQLRRYRELNDRPESADAKSQSLPAENKELQWLQTRPGIGAIMALMIMAEAGDLRRFSDRRQSQLRPLQRERL
jgi:transposase